MIYCKLGSSGLDIPVVGFGAWAIGGWMWGGADERGCPGSTGSGGLRCGTAWNTQCFPS
jgi:hypothetical protein